MSGELVPPAWQCDCPEAVCLRTFVDLLKQNDAYGALDTLASLLAVWKLRSASHEVSRAADWSRSYSSYATRNSYPIVIPDWAVSSNEMLARRRGEVP